MAQFSKQFAIVNKLKSLVKRTGMIFISKPDLGITEEIAKKIQKSAYDLSHRKGKDSYTPPYLMIAEQLQVEDEQIFKAAVFNLSLIAINEPKNAPAILDILGKYTDDFRRNIDETNYLKAKISKITQSLNNLQ